MVPLALVLALGAAFLHALWNLLVAGSKDSQAATAIASLSGVVVFSPVVLLTFDARPEALPWLLVSSALVLLYLWLLGVLYERAELSVAYPVARGLAPVIVLVVGWLFLAARATELQALAVVLVAAGVMFVRGLRGRAGRRDTALAVAVAACIAGYTLVDKTGIQYASPLTYMALVTLPSGIVLVARAWRRCGVAELRTHVTPSAVLAGVGMFLAYTLVLAALTIAPAAPVAAVRESSVVMATAMGAIFLRERVGRVQFLGAVAVAVGVALLSVR
jgi:drug/metabolite transporter (DMT)-like permease